MQDQIHSTLATSLSNSAYDLSENTKTQSLSNAGGLSVDTLGNQQTTKTNSKQSNSKSEKSLVKKELASPLPSSSEHKYFDNLKFKLPNLKNEDSTEHKLSSLSKCNEEIRMVAPSTSKDTSKTEESNGHDADNDDGDDDDVDDEAFPKTLEGLLVKQWNLGIELVNEKCASNSESFDIIKLLNLLSECKKENKELEQRLLNLEKKKIHLEALNCKLSNKFDDASETNPSMSVPMSSINYTQHESQNKNQSTHPKSQTPLSSTTALPRSASAHSCHNSSVNLNTASATYGRKFKF